MIPNVLTIAGTDPTGGAGIQADLKTFSALGAYGMSAITAVVAQNTCGVRSFVALEPDFVGEQIDAVFDDVRVDAVKVGMIANAAIARVVADRLRRYARCPVVVDPVMVAKSGDHLLLPDAVAALRDELLPLATLITPNLPEAAVLLDRPPPQTLDDMRRAARTVPIGAAMGAAEGRTSACAAQYRSAGRSGWHARTAGAAHQHHPRSRDRLHAGCRCGGVVGGKRRGERGASGEGLSQCGAGGRR
jgi:hypothetical protein